MAEFTDEQLRARDVARKDAQRRWEALESMSRPELEAAAAEVVAGRQRGRQGRLDASPEIGDAVDRAVLSAIPLEDLRRLVASSLPVF